MVFGAKTDKNEPNESEHCTTRITIRTQTKNLSTSLFKFPIQYAIVMKMNGNNTKIGTSINSFDK